jgi:predicted Zn-ribbon and HTH transcriptional regulator
MAKVKLEVWGYRCERCGHAWQPRNETQAPRVCPKCKSPYWDRPRKGRSQDATDGRQEC